MVSLKSFTPPRASARRDFSRASHRAPVMVKRLTRAYNQKPVSWWQRWRWHVLGACAVLVVGAVLYAPIFTIKNIIVDNAPSHQTELRITELVHNLIAQTTISPLPQSNLIFFNATQAHQAIDQEFFIQGLTFSRQWPNVLRIVAPQDTVVALWRAGEQSYLVNGHGTLVQQLMSELPPPNLLTIQELKPLPHKLGDQVAPEAPVQFLKGLRAAWAEQLPSVTLTYVAFDPSALPTLQAYTQTGWYALLSAEQLLSSQILAIKRLLEEQIKTNEPKLEYIDVRFGSRLYYKLR